MQFMNTLSRHINVEKAALEPLLHSALDDCFLLISAPADFVKSEFEDKSNTEYSSKQAKSLLKYIKVLNEEFEDFFNVQANGTYEDVFEIAEDYFADVELNAAQETILSEFSQIQPISFEELVEDEELVDVIDFGDELEEEDIEEEAAVDDQVGASAQEEVFSEDDEDPGLVEPASGNGEEINADEVEEVEEEGQTEIHEEEPDVSEPAETVEDVANLESATINDQFKVESGQSVASHLEESKEVKGMLNAISVNQQYMFTQELYGGDANTFQKSIAEIDVIESFDEAVEHLVSNYAKQFDWDMNSDEVKELLKVIFRRFR